jgi:hypothetical protein
MSCRVARWQIVNTADPATCHDCGAHALETFYSSARLGYDLCVACFQPRLDRGLVKEAEAPPAIHNSGTR